MATTQQSTAPVQQIVVPSPAVLTLAAKIAIQQDRPIQLDYYVETAQGKAFLVEDTENKENKVLLKSRDEYTSLVTKIHKAEEDYLVLTENSLYIVNGRIGKKKVALASLAQD